MKCFFKVVGSFVCLDERKFIPCLRLRDNHCFCELLSCFHL